MPDAGGGSEVLQPAGEGVYEVSGRDKLKVLCPHCHIQYVLFVWPGGFMACPNPICKAAALDQVMDAEKQQ